MPSYQLVDGIFFSLPHWQRSSAGNLGAAGTLTMKWLIHLWVAKT